jgi:hypothetical protein
MKPFCKGDLLILHLTDDCCVHLLVVHVVSEKLFYCWDRTNETYRLIYDKPHLHLLCPNFDANYPSDIDWSNEWMFEMYTRGYDLGQEPEDPMPWAHEGLSIDLSNVDAIAIVPTGSTS